MIQTESESLIALRDVPAHIEKLTGNRPHIASIYRWINTGIASVTLESLLIGGKPFTSKEALNRFWEASTKAKKNRHSNAVKAGISQAQQRRKNAIENEAESLGI